VYAVCAWCLYMYACMDMYIYIYI